MGVEISEIELKKTKGKSEKKPPKEDEVPAEQAIPKKKKVQKIKVETGPAKAEAEKVKEPEETAEPEAVVDEAGASSPPFASARVKDEEKPEKQKKPEPTSQNFALKKLGGQDGQLAVDVYQTDTELVIRSAIAGIKTEDLDISIESDSVIIRGIREHPPEKSEKNYFYQECYWGPFSRQIILPEETDSGRAEASMKEGILTIRIPKIERKEKRKILVKG